MENNIQDIKNNNIKEVMIFAAGYGSRMLNATINTPKPLLLINEKPIIKYVLDNIANSLVNIEKVVINVFYLKDKIINYIYSIKQEYKFDIILSIEEEKLEVGGGLKNALKHFNSNTIFTLNADSFVFGLDVLNLLYNYWQKDTMNCLMYCTETSNIIGQVAYDFSIETNDNSNSIDINNIIITLADTNNLLKNQETIGILRRINRNLTYTGAQIINLDLIKSYINKTNAFSIIEVLFNSNSDQEKIFGIKTDAYHKYLHANTQEQLINVSEYMKLHTKEAKFI
ncbi:MAG: NTP transferase domain-containing protein [Rickettsiales bacterium]